MENIKVNDTISYRTIPDGLLKSGRVLSFKFHEGLCQMEYKIQKRGPGGHTETVFETTNKVKLKPKIKNSHYTLRMAHNPAKDLLRKAKR